MTDRQILNRNLAQMLKGGVIMDVTNAQEAEIAEAAGAVAVMALERVPSDIRRDGGVARMSDPKLIKDQKRRIDSGNGQGQDRSHCGSGDFGGAGNRLYR